MNQNVSPQEIGIANTCICCGSSALEKSPAILMPFVAHRIFGWEPVEITNEWGLKTISNGMAYTICNSVQCTKCGVIFLDIRFTEDQMNSLYNGYREKEYVELREKYEPGYRERNDGLNLCRHYITEIEKFLSPYVHSPIRILDWGGDDGKNTPFKNNNGLFHVFDISNKPVIEGAVRIDKSTAKSTSYNLIVCSNVLEHVSYPAEVIFDIKNSMNKDTILYIELPHEEIVRTSNSFKGLLKKKKHWHEHINFFTERSIEKLLTRCGLSILEIKPLDASIGENSAHLFLIACKLQ